jgi:hypothetical protein
MTYYTVVLRADVMTEVTGIEADTAEQAEELALKETALDYEVDFNVEAVYEESE